MKRYSVMKYCVLSALFTLCIVNWKNPAADEPLPLRFDTSDHGEPGDRAPVVKPWKSIALDPEYGGWWVVTGDVDGDGVVDVVSSENVNNVDVHYTSTAVAQRLDGSVIWRWGNPEIGRKEWHHDVACQIYDWDGDGRNEVVLLTKGFLVELDGATGTERRRIPIAEDATDCLVFCNVSGNSRAADVLVKNRYEQIWVYDYGGTLLWTVTMPGGYRTAHQPRPYDIDGDGRDEIMAGYSMLNPDGTVRWTVSSSQVDLTKGHLDCCRLMRKGVKGADEWRFVVTYCGALAIACIDGNGATVWERTGYHFESLNVGRIFPDIAGPQILFDIDHVPEGESPVWVFDENGRKLGQIVSDYCRHHALLDWTGDGYDEIIIAHARGIFDRTGARIATLACDDSGVTVQTGDMTGDGVIDIAITTPAMVHIFRNANGRKAEKPVPLGCGVNYTLY
ncbi:hypothetical protein LLG96_14115 [bacterium]|nr:hypothetical protein [bacterium]